ncbi:MAG: DUF3047 domain-containing protein [Rubrivivax sp.]|nr:DUF3047 domain-containing protein [Rubrivivax sp.]
MAERGLNALRRSLLLAGGAALAGCAHRGAPPQADWHEVRLPGKVATQYRWEHKAGRRALAAYAQASASMWRRRLDVQPDRIGDVGFSWWVDQLIAGASVAHAEHEDSPVRVVFGFDGDRSRLSARTRAMFELAEALTGEQPPFATLMYVWENQAPVGSVVTNPRTDRIRKIVADSGPAQLGRWRDHRRHLADDFRLAYGEAPGRLVSVALMTDADNTRSTARAWYGPVQL